MIFYGFLQPHKCSPFVFTRLAFDTSAEVWNQTSYSPAACASFRLVGWQSCFCSGFASRLTTMSEEGSAMLAWPEHARFAMEMCRGKPSKKHQSPSFASKPRRGGGSEGSPREPMRERRMNDKNVRRCFLECRMLVEH